MRDNSIYSKAAVSPRENKVDESAIRNIVQQFDGDEIAALLNQVEKELISRAEDSQNSLHNTSVEKVQKLHDVL